MKIVPLCLAPLRFDIPVGKGSITAVRADSFIVRRVLKQVSARVRIIVIPHFHPLHLFSLLGHSFLKACNGLGHFRDFSN